MFFSAPVRAPFLFIVAIREKGDFFIEVQAHGRGGRDFFLRHGRELVGVVHRNINVEEIALVGMIPRSDLAPFLVRRC